MSATTSITEATVQAATRIPLTDAAAIDPATVAVNRMTNTLSTSQPCHVQGVQP